MFLNHTQEMMSPKHAKYAELHCKSFYSFGQGASHVHELLAKASEYGYPALALTDTNLCGALEFARLANSLGIKPISGCELTLTDGSLLALLAKTREGYGNIARTRSSDLRRGRAAGRRRARAGSRLARGEAAPEGQGRYHIRDHRGRDRGRASHTMAPYLRAV